MRIAAAAAALSVSVGAAGAAQAQTFLADAAAPTAADAGLAAAPAIAYDQDALAYDPLEGWNRGVYAFNEVVDKAVTEPLARGYRAVTPTFVRQGVRNALDNLDAPVTFANDVLQGSPKRAGVTAARFGINTTIGVLGLFDVAKTMGLPDHDEDFGQTLGKWGMGGGPYLVLPLLGPSNVRDLGGRVVDTALDPITYAQFEGDDEARIARTGLTLLSAREAAIEAIENLRNSSTDPYVTMRSLYALARQSAIRNGHQNVEDLPDFEDPMAMETTPESVAPEAAPAEPATPPEDLPPVP